MADWYEASGFPGPRRFGDSAGARAEFAAIAEAFAKLPALAGNAKRLSTVNAAGTAQVVVDLYFDDVSNRLGIGIASPQDALHIAEGGKIRLDRADATRHASIYHDDQGLKIEALNAGDQVQIYSANELIIYGGTTPAERMRVDTSGNVGIGMAPTHKLDVMGSERLNSASGTEVKLQLFQTDVRAWSIALPAGSTNFVIRDESAGLNRLEISTTGNFFVRNSTSAPATPSGGGAFYVESGALKFRGSSGTITVLAPA